MGFCRAVKWSRIRANFQLNPLPQPSQMSVGTMTDAACVALGSGHCLLLSVQVSHYLLPLIISWLWLDLHVQVLCRLGT